MYTEIFISYSDASASEFLEIVEEMCPRDWLYIVDHEQILGLVLS